MRRNVLPQLALALLVTIAVIGGILTVGGPGQGRLERRDQTRLDDLTRLSQLVTCLARLNGNTLPDALTDDPRCGKATLADPYTGAPYVYEKLSETSYRLCAGFEKPGRLQTYRGSGFNPDTGCRTSSYRP